VRADEKLAAFLELEAAIRAGNGDFGARNCNEPTGSQTSNRLIIQK
jgi:hypothetical protein